MSGDIPVQLSRTEPPLPVTSAILGDWLAAQQFPNSGELFRRLVDCGLADLPLPGAGETSERWKCLQVLGSYDPSLARLTEGHADALAILHEAGLEPPAAKARCGVWAAGPLDGITAIQTADGWCLSGVRRWCSGAALLTHALVTAAVDDCPMLFLVPLDRPGVRPVERVWQAVGMAESGTDDVAFCDVELGSDSLVGGSNFYLQRRGFWLGSIGVAAVWLGGAQGIARAISSIRRELSPHQMAHLGATWSRLTWLERGFVDLAEQIDRHGLGGSELELLARSFRIEVEAGATEVLARSGRATGAEPLGHDRSHARLAADLPVYLRQSHAESLSWRRSVDSSTSDRLTMVIDLARRSPSASRGEDELLAQIDDDPLSVPLRIVVAAPHPDDEILSLGGFLSRCARAGSRIKIVAVSDGERAYVRADAEDRKQLVKTRARERKVALNALGLSASPVH